MTEPFTQNPLVQELEAAEADFIAATRRLERLRAELGLRPLGLEDFPAEYLAAGFDDWGEQRKKPDGDEKRETGPASHEQPPTVLHLAAPDLGQQYSRSSQIGDEID